MSFPFMSLRSRSLNGETNKSSEMCCFFPPQQKIEAKAKQDKKKKIHIHPQNANEYIFGIG